MLGALNNWRYILLLFAFTISTAVVMIDFVFAIITLIALFFIILGFIIFVILVISGGLDLR